MPYRRRLTAHARRRVRQNIEALALEVALRDLSSPERIRPLVPMLDQIRRQAESAQMTAVAEAASVTSASCAGASRCEFRDCNNSSRHK